jgi:glycosyltransferase involved in cell wall biosynthesis
MTRIGNKQLVIISEMKSAQSAAFTRINAYTQALRNKGQKIFIFSIYSDLNTIIEIGNGVRMSKLTDERSSFGMRLVRKGTAFFRTFFFLRSIERLVEAGKKCDTSYLLYSSRFSPVFLCAFYLGKIKKRQVFIEKSELTISWYVFRPWYVSLFRHSYFVSALVDFILPAFYDGAIVISRRMEILQKKINGNTLKIPCLFMHQDETQGLADIGKSPFIIGYFGTISKKNTGLESFMQAMKYFDHENILFNIYGAFGSDSDRSYLYKFVKSLSLEKIVFFRGILTREEVGKIMKQSHLLIMPRPSNLQNEFGMATKLAEYMSTGVPVLVSDVCDNGFYVRDSENGFLVQGGDKESIRQGLERVFKNRDRLNDIGRKGREMASESFSPDVYSEDLYSFLFSTAKRVS